MKVDQADVLERAVSAIARSPHLINKRIRVTVDGDCIRLQGTVGTFFEKQIAQETLRLVVAPLRIENDMVVSWGGTPASRERELECVG